MDSALAYSIISAINTFPPICSVNGLETSQELGPPSPDQWSCRQELANISHNLFFGITSLLKWEIKHCKA